MSVEDLSGEMERGLVSARALDLSTEEVIARLRCEEFLATYLEQVQSGTIERWLESLDLGAGVLRASVVGRELAETHAHRRRSMLIDGEHLSNERLPRAGVGDGEIKAALCFAHDILLDDPFDEEQVLADFAASVHEVMPDTRITIAPDPEHFCGHRAGADLTGSAGTRRVVAFAPRRLSMDARLAGAFARNAWDLGGESREGLASGELARRSLRLWLASGGRYVPCSALIATRPHSSPRRNCSQPRSWLRTSRGSGGSSRSHYRRPGERAHNGCSISGMLTCSRTLGRGSARLCKPWVLEPMVRLPACSGEEMKVAAVELGRRVKQKPLLVEGMPKYLNWGVGSIGLAVHDWRLIAAGLGGITAEVLAERFLGHSGVGDQALVHHYAPLATL
ncbi:hypothetical protein ACQPYH_28230 [Kribbella sp. CA-245084]|uniref:hypothetical protein n=1 Tax=Kribbella sp. CA-245084 TaxID=3239940 RepID=UPI003D944224